ncbi:MAG: ATPase domain-containing protein [Nanoarchaeota archaeon]|nr:ATPase domain-containing protein [Nanoarchaeota archaeon]
MVMVPIERCPTGIPGFDKITQGGFVRNSDNILTGGPGFGKTTFLLQFLWNGATKFNENGLYCSFEPDIVETLKDAMSYGWDFTKLNEQDRVKFLKFSPRTSIEDLKNELTRLISRYSIQRVCLDPVSVLALNINDEGKIREMVFELSSLMKRLNVTSILADESLESQNLTGSDVTNLNKTDIMKFLADSVTNLYESGLSGVGDRALRISKMRRTNHARTLIGMRITSKGIEIFPPEEKMQAMAMPSQMPQQQSQKPQQPASKPVQQASMPQTQTTQLRAISPSVPAQQQTQTSPQQLQR